MNLSLPTLSVPQQRFTATPTDTYTLRHLVGGRGSGKTHAAAMLLLRSCLSWNPGRPHIWTFPTYRDCLDVGLRTWQEIFPRRLYRYHSSDKTITIPCTGSYIDLRSRQTDNSQKEVQRGPNYAVAVNDELAKDKTRNNWQLIHATVRDPKANLHLVCSTSTPKANWYRQLVTQSKNTEAIYTTSFDNPALDKAFITSILNESSDEYAQQEIYGRWVSTEGRCWKEFIEANWPSGNIHYSKWDPEKPWFIAMDLGQGTGYWCIIQYHNPVSPTGTEIYPARVRIPVIVGEGLQRQESIHSVLHRIETEYCNQSNFRQPVRVAVGHDVNTRGSTGPAPSYELDKRGWEYFFPQGDYADKRLQGQILAGLLCNAKGERRLCVSKDLRRHGPQGDWGITNTFLTDEWPEPGSTVAYRKDKKQLGIYNCEDSRDALMYFAMMNHPPTWS